MDKAKEAIVQKLKASGCRITKQRLMLLDYTGRKLFLLQRNLLPRIPDRSKYRNSNRIPDDQQAGGNRSDQSKKYV